MPGRNTVLLVMERLVVQENGCCLWPNAKYRGGYGRVRFRGRPYVVHKLLYEKLIGPVPEGCELHHTCETPACGNPWHLQPLTSKNHPKRRPLLDRTHCPAGHAYAG